MSHDAGNQVSHVLDFHKVPFGYCWSEALVPKPPDWGRHIDVVGFFSLAEGKLTSYQPSPELAEFLADGASQYLSPDHKPPYPCLSPSPDRTLTPNSFTATKWLKPRPRPFSCCGRHELPA